MEETRHADGYQHLVTQRVGACSARNPDIRQDDCERE